MMNSITLSIPEWILAIINYKVLGTILSKLFVVVIILIGGLLFVFIINKILSILIKKMIGFNASDEDVRILSVFLGIISYILVLIISFIERRG